MKPTTSMFSVLVKIRNSGNNIRNLHILTRSAILLTKSMQFYSQLKELTTSMWKFLDGVSFNRNEWDEIESNIWGEILNIENLYL